ncbi:MAG: hypothetical protein LBL98_01900 [Ruminococcus sp.]|jgi:hypothetical protein|nr:hypothetical protein [Ruminococcus sp.]
MNLKLLEIEEFYQNPIKKSDAILLEVKPIGDDYRPCVKAIVDIYDRLTTSEDEYLEIYVYYGLLGLPVDRLRELCDKRFFIMPFRMWDENKILAENPDAKVDILMEEFGVSEEVAREAEVFVHNVNPRGGVRFLKTYKIMELTPCMSWAAHSFSTC